MKFTGTGVALITPMQEDGSIYPEDLRRMAEHVIDGGVDYIVALGSTGEALSLHPTEHREVLDILIDQIAGRVALVAGNMGGVRTRGIVDRIRQYDFTGIDGIMVSAPYYVKPRAEGLYQHYSAISRASTLPIIIYNVPGRTACNIPAPTIARLCQEQPAIAAVKEANTDPEQINTLIEQAPDHVAILSGDDPTALDTLTKGAHGNISVIANALPEQWSRLIRSARSGALTEAKMLHESLYHIHDLLYREGNPAGIKAACSHLGLCPNTLRLPLVPVSSALDREIQAAMSRTAAVI